MERISLSLESNFDSDQFLKNLHLLTGMTVTLYNSHRLWVSSYPIHDCAFCKLLRSNKNYNTRCRANDAEAFDCCTEQRKMIVYRCYAGLYEIMIPLYNQDTICGYLMLGQTMEEGDEAKQKYFEKLCAAKPDMPKEILLDAVNSTYSLSEEKLMAIAHAAQIYAEYISEKNLMKNEINSLANLVASYIKEHLTEKITNAELCYVFLCDRKKLASEFRKAHGMTIVEYTNDLRLHKAWRMLRKNPDFNISYLASAVGFSYQSYFSTLFYKKYGMSPTDMQKLFKEEMKNKEKEGEKT